MEFGKRHDTTDATDFFTRQVVGEYGLVTVWRHQSDKDWANLAVRQEGWMQRRNATSKLEFPRSHARWHAVKFTSQFVRSRSWPLLL